MKGHISGFQQDIFALTLQSARWVSQTQMIYFFEKNTFVV